MKYGILFIETITTLGGVIMKVIIVGKNVKVTPAIAEKVNKKLDHLTKYFLIDDNVTA